MYFTWKKLLRRAPWIVALAATLAVFPNEAEAGCSMTLHSATESALTLLFDANSCSRKHDNGKAKVKLCLKRAGATTGACTGGTIEYKSTWSGSHTFSGLLADEPYKLKMQYKRKRRFGSGVLWYKADKMTTNTLASAAATDENRVWIVETNESEVVIGWTAADPAKYDDFRIKKRRQFEPYWRNATKKLSTAGGNPYEAAVTDLKQGKGRHYAFKVIGRARTGFFYARDYIGEVVRAGLGGFKDDGPNIPSLPRAPSTLAPGTVNGVASVLRVLEGGELVRYFWKEDRWQVAPVEVGDARIVPGSLVAGLRGRTLGVTEDRRILVAETVGGELRTRLVGADFEVVPGSLADGGKRGVYGVDYEGRLVLAGPVSFLGSVSPGQDPVRRPVSTEAGQPPERVMLDGGERLAPGRFLAQLQWSLQVVPTSGRRIVPGSLVTDSEGELFGVDASGRLATTRQGSDRSALVVVAESHDLVPGSLVAAGGDVFGVTRQGSLARARWHGGGWRFETTRGQGAGIDPGSLLAAPGGQVLGLDTSGRLIGSLDAGEGVRWEYRAAPSLRLAPSLVAAGDGRFFTLSTGGRLVALRCDVGGCTSSEIKSRGGILFPESLVGKPGDVFGVNEHGQLWHTWTRDGERLFALIDP